MGRLTGLAAIMLILYTNSLQSQEIFSIAGKVLNQKGQPLPFATVIIKSMGIGTVSDSNGNYLLEGIKNGRHTLTINVLGFREQSRIVTIRKANLMNVDFRLEEDTEDLEEVVVLGKSDASKLQESAQAVTVVTTETVKLQTADLGEIMAKTEGVSVQRGGGLGSNARFALGGLSGDQVRFFYNGVPLDFSPYAFGLANVPVNAIERVEVYKGVVPIQFGADALGGAVNLVPPQTNKKLGGSVSYQTGSFGTHRATANLEHYNEDSGFFASFGGFYDYTDNNYKIDVAVPNELGQLEQFEVERFHDAYRAFGANFTIGLRNKKWAKELSLEGYYGDYDNEIQNSQAPGLINEPQLGINNAVAGSPFGEVVFTSFSTGANLHYNLELGKKWAIDLRGGYNYNERESLDVGNNLYNWFGEVVRIQNQPGEFGPADNLITKSENVFARQQVTFEISKGHSLNLSLAPTHGLRTGDDLLIDGPFDPALDEGRLFDFVSGLEYQAELFNEKLENVAFVKNYRQNVRIESLDPSVDQVLVDERSVSEFGAGNGLRYEWSERFSTKLSYEFAYRLPRLDEIFGDGQFIQENLELRPENSHNINLQWDYTGRETSKVQWQLQGNFFLRRVDDLIFLLVNADEFGSFQNVWSATSEGVEFGGSISNIIKGLTLSANTTYQDYRNTSDTGPFTAFRGDRIPNVPYFFVNGAVEYGFESLFRKGDDLSLFWNLRHVGAFFVGWESAGLQQFKAEVPDQTVQNAGVTYRMELGKLQNSITLEGQNLANAKVFDFFGVQRPGRAVFVKLTTQF
ncbi:MAG: carboxypeptidase-like regulatory domain-containing protein [Bacteroidota bacterium]